MRKLAIRRLLYRGLQVVTGKALRDSTATVYNFTVAHFRAYYAWEIENPKTDAAYRYYLRGPLARMELGNFYVEKQ